MTDETTIETDAPVIDAGESTPVIDDIPEAPKRRRGRPPGSTNKLKPEAISVDGATKPKRGRPRKDAGPRDVNSLARQIFGLHTLAAMATGIPEATIGEQESVMLATALDSVADQYGLSLDGKTGAAIQLIATAAMIYAPRVVAVRARIAAQSAAADAVNAARTVDTESSVAPVH